MEKVKLFYHATTSAMKPKILSAKALTPQIHKPSSDWMWLLDPKHKDTIPKGVWFCSTLYNGDLPNISPYGKERMKISIKSVISQLGGKISLYHGKDSTVKTNKYVRLMVVKEGDKFDCLKHMEKLDPKDNNWLKFISDTECQVAKRPNWVEVFCPYTIDIKDGDWDTVE
ncbi:uncharacterized protein LOC117319342 [Pecten maximus]|uniref:uncharacterized protein LOC117319342 n=1 Tax=Pecten maximus TaxID=6579 RepID=UPI0014588CBE|nr:uncharacterized protein LOC117319342 [Pecten maximus]